MRINKIIEIYKVSCNLKIYTKKVLNTQANSTTEQNLITVNKRKRIT